MLSDEHIAKCLRATLPRTKCTTGYVAFARAIEREATVQMLEQIKEDEALMRDVFNAYENGVGMIAAINAIRQRLEAKK